ncbi:hypothetical protein RHMOL_Rhmol11G0216400 [Rhododendron molle]|uniref:Uncharacterized protein n=1 Tax=Rhododendron molle TaxID=49168 RepID=A0ACC0LUT3_RHOML|nr:hypothetical protein RHMOL_Rhmol11G0216400 [Rhododendron molle]
MEYWRNQSPGDDARLGFVTHFHPNLGPLEDCPDVLTECLNKSKAKKLNLLNANVDTPDVFKHNCLSSVGKKWRDWKDELKKDHYDFYDNDEDCLANCPDRVDADQWSILVKFWGTQAAKVLGFVFPCFCFVSLNRETVRAEKDS